MIASPALATPYYSPEYCPKDSPWENLAWRTRWRERAVNDKGLQRDFRQAASEDVLFFFNAFGWVLEPRSKQKIQPFCTWSHQDPVIVAMDNAIDRAESTGEPIDVVLDKSRAQGGTYIYLNLFLRRWLRDREFKAGLVTRNEALVDSATDSDTLLWKFNWALERLPVWMLPEGYSEKRHRSLSDHTFLNPENNALVAGYAAGQDVGRGGRKTVFAADEIGARDFIKGGKDTAVMEAIADVTNCVFLVSTFGADTGVFYDAAHTEDASGLHLVLDWKDNPVQTTNAYTIRQGLPHAERPAEQKAVDNYFWERKEDVQRLYRRGYKMEGQFRSPWYDSRCLRRISTPRLIAKELDRNPRGAAGKVFDVDVLDGMERACRPADWRGRIVFDETTLRVKGLIKQDYGPLELWFTPDHDRQPPRSRYALAGDISAGGTGDYSSNSVLCGLDRMTGEQVLQYTVMGMLATKFGRVAAGLAKWLYNAFLGWEDSGIAKPFAKEVLEVINYQNIYYRDTETVGDYQTTRKPGWWPGSDDAKGALFESLCLAMEEGVFVPRSKELVKECGEYEWDGGKIVHRPSAQTAAAAGKAHGDRCVAAGVTWLLCESRPAGSADDEQLANMPAPVGSIAWLCQQEALERRQFDDDHPQMTLRDVLAKES